MALKRDPHIWVVPVEEQAALSVHHTPPDLLIPVYFCNSTWKLEGRFKHSKIVVPNAKPRCDEGQQGCPTAMPLLMKASYQAASCTEPQPQAHSVLAHDS